MAEELKVVAVMSAKPGSEQVVRDALTALVPPTRDEAGCRSYELFESAAAPGVFVTIESWNGQDDLNAHLQSAHVAEAFAAAGQHLQGDPRIHPLRAL